MRSWSLAFRARPQIRPTLRLGRTPASLRSGRRGKGPVRLLGNAPQAARVERRAVDPAHRSRHALERRLSRPRRPASARQRRRGAGRTARPRRAIGPGAYRPHWRLSLEREGQASRAVRATPPPDRPRCLAYVFEHPLTGPRAAGAASCGLRAIASRKSPARMASLFPACFPPPSSPCFSRCCKGMILVRDERGEGGGNPVGREAHRQGRRGPGRPKDPPAFGPALRTRALGPPSRRGRVAAGVSPPQGRRPKAFAFRMAPAGGGVKRPLPR
jgi:hypothetical protein